MIETRRDEGATDGVAGLMAKPFAFGLVGDAVGPQLVRQIVGVNATGPE